MSTLRNLEAPLIAPLHAVPRGLRLWTVDLGSDASEALRTLLSADEIRRSERFVFERDRCRYVAARGALRRILGGELGIAPAELQFGYGEHGKPALRAVRDLQFNLSHSEDAAVIAVGGSEPVGVDVEMFKDIGDALALATAHFSPAERACIEARTGEDRSRAFLTIWTRKEACLKAVGSGFSIPAASFEAGIGGSVQVVRVTAGHTVHEIELWTLRAFADRVISVARQRVGDPGAGPRAVTG
jgi:4'-phosphopantetheinyl transferase